MIKIILPDSEAGKFYTPGEAGAMLGVKDQTIRRYIRDGLIEAKRWPGRHFAIEAKEIARFAHDILGRELEG